MLNRNVRVVLKRIGVAMVIVGVYSLANYWDHVAEQEALSHVVLMTQISE